MLNPLNIRGKSSSDRGGSKVTLDHKFKSQFPSMFPSSNIKYPTYWDLTVKKKKKKQLEVKCDFFLYNFLVLSLAT